MTGRIRGLAVGGAVIAAAVVVVTLAARADGDFNPCAAPAPRDPRIIIAFIRSNGILGIGAGCKAYVHPEKKKVCQGDTVSWSVINTCDSETFSNLLIPDLNDVTTTPCSGQTVAYLGVGKAEQIRCTLKGGIAAKTKYSVASGNKVLVDPELDIRR